jgi:hypothetical protein
MSTSEKSGVPDASMRRSARLAVGAGVLAIFILGVSYNRGDWALSLVHTFLFTLVVLVGARIALGKMLWKLLF